MDQDAVLALGPLQVAGDLVQLVQPPALGVGDQQLDLGQGLLEGRLDPLAQRLQPLAREGRDQHRVGMGELDLVALVLAQQVGLVEDQQPRLLAGADLLQHLVDRLHVDQPPLLAARRRRRRAGSGRRARSPRGSP